MRQAYVFESGWTPEPGTLDAPPYFRTFGHMAWRAAISRPARVLMCATALYAGAAHVAHRVADAGIDASIKSTQCYESGESGSSSDPGRLSEQPCGIVGLFLPQER